MATDLEAYDKPKTQSIRDLLTPYALNVALLRLTYLAAMSCRMGRCGDARHIAARLKEVRWKAECARYRNVYNEAGIN